MSYKAGEKGPPKGFKLEIIGSDAVGTAVLYDGDNRRGDSRNRVPLKLVKLGATGTDTLELMVELSDGSERVIRYTRTESHSFMKGGKVAKRFTYDRHDSHENEN